MAHLVPELKLDWERLMAPIAPDKPCGVDLRYDPVYDQIRDLRRREDPEVPQGVWQRERKQADWTAVASECLDALETQSKDLQIAAWLLEAWLHTYGFRGAAEGFRLMHALCDRFWDDLHPRIQNDDPEFRIGPIVWVNDKLPVALKLIPLTAPETTDVHSYALVDWEKASQAETQRGTDGQAKASAATFAQLHQSATLTASSSLVSTLEAAGRVIRHCAELDRLLDCKLGREAPSLLPVKIVGEAVVNIISKVLRGRGSNAFDLQENATSEDSISILGNALLEAQSPDFNRKVSASDSVAERITTRAHAYHLLGEVAAFLSRTEPHSPAPYLIRRAIAWGAMSFDELLPELVKNQAELVEIHRLLNLRPADATKK